MFLAVLSSFAASLFAPWLYQISGRAAGWFLDVSPIGLTLYFGSFLAAVSSGEVPFFFLRMGAQPGNFLFFLPRRFRFASCDSHQRNRRIDHRLFGGYLTRSKANGPA
jgi:hypothetical protein